MTAELCLIGFNKTLLFDSSFFVYYYYYFRLPFLLLPVYGGWQPTLMAHYRHQVEWGSGVSHIFVLRVKIIELK